MKPEDKNAVLQFMGQVYGESKKNDGMLVGQSTNLQPNSDKVKHVFEQTLQTPVQREPQGNQPVPRAVDLREGAAANELVRVELVLVLED